MNLDNIIGTYVIDVLRYAGYRMLEVRWLSTQQFNTLYRITRQTFLAYLDFSLQPNVGR